MAILKEDLDPIATSVQEEKQAPGARGLVQRALLFDPSSYRSCDACWLASRRGRFAYPCRRALPSHDHSDQIAVSVVVGPQGRPGAVLALQNLDRRLGGQAHLAIRLAVSLSTSTVLLFSSGLAEYRRRRRCRRQGQDPLLAPEAGASTSKEDHEHQGLSIGDRFSDVRTNEQSPRRLR